MGISAIKNAVQATKIIAKRIPVAAAATALIGLKVDGRSVKVAEGATLLDAINKSGSHVPTLCFHPEFEPKAVCEYIGESLIGTSTRRVTQSIIYLIVILVYRSFVPCRC